MAFMAFVPWWPICKSWRRDCLSWRGIKGLPAAKTTPSTVYSSSRICQYSAILGGTLCLSFGNPAEIIFTSCIYWLSIIPSFFILVMWISLVFAFTLMLAIKACSISLVLDLMDCGTGILDIVFGPQFFIPGICTTVNLYRRVRSRILSTLGYFDFVKVSTVEYRY